MRAGDLTTPALLADAGVLAHNVATMSAQRPGPALRPHVKAFKCTAQLLGRQYHQNWKQLGEPTIAEGLSYVGSGESVSKARQRLSVVSLSP